VILRDLRLGIHDVLVGINLLREGLDLPEVSLVAVLDADKEGFLRSTSALIQTMGRAARNVNGTVILYADTVTRSMTAAIEETNRRRRIQEEYNRIHGIEPQSIIKSVDDELARVINADYVDITGDLKENREFGSLEELEQELETIHGKMMEAADSFDYEAAAVFRDRLRELQKLELEMKDSP
jgi:excinuclease ABC subunit B